MPVPTIQRDEVLELGRLGKGNTALPLPNFVDGNLVSWTMRTLHLGIYLLQLLEGFFPGKDFSGFIKTYSLGEELRGYQVAIVTRYYMYVINHLAIPWKLMRDEYERLGYFSLPFLFHASPKPKITKDVDVKLDEQQRRVQFITDSGDEDLLAPRWLPEKVFRQKKEKTRRLKRKNAGKPSRMVSQHF